MKDPHDADVPLSGDALLREIAWTFDRHGIAIVHQDAEIWELRYTASNGTGFTTRLQIERMITALSRKSLTTRTDQQRLLQQIAGLMIDPGTDGLAAAT